MSSATIIIIGNEILSGKFVDENTPWLLQKCKALGIKVDAVYIISDDINTIAQTVRKSAAQSKYVFTTGGVGPTHDDMTMKGIAKAWDEELVVAPKLKELIVAKVGDSEGALRMALVPESYELWDSPHSTFPQVVVRNVIIFPGVPKLMKYKFERIEDRLEGRTSFHKRLHLNIRESQIAIELEDIQKNFPEVDIGSYPRFDEGDVTLILTLDAQDEAKINKCFDVLKSHFTDYLCR